ncbi:prolyl oligopeptidase family serine peptidase [Weissella kandleri]|uniref:prolyl oligopeptidase family serine peptidase n=1 Tax=Weissella kandleri TaxID=1616 RepID=UPI00387ED950
MMQSDTINEFDQLNLKQPQIVNDKIYILKQRELGASYYDLVQVVDGEMRVLRHAVEQISSNQDNLYYLQRGRIFQMRENEEDLELGVGSSRIKEIHAIPDCDAVFYLTEGVSQWRWNPIEMTQGLQMSVAGVTELPLQRSQNVENRLYFANLNGEQRYIKKFELPVRIADVLNAQKLLLIDTQLTPTGESGHERLIELEVQPDLTKVFSRRSWWHISEAQYGPKGEQILIVAADEQDGGGERAQLYLFDRAKQRITLQYQEEALNVQNHEQNHHLQWMDAEHYLFVTDYHGHSRLYLSDLSGKKERISDQREILTTLLVQEHQILGLQMASNQPVQLVDLAQRKTLVQSEHASRLIAAEKFVFRDTTGEFIDGWFLPNAQRDVTGTIIWLGADLKYGVGESYQSRLQWLAHQGFNVVWIHQPGMSGYRGEYAQVHVWQDAEQIQTTLMKGIHAAQKQHAELVDGKLYVIGSQAGATLAAQLLADQPQNFTAGILCDPIVDWPAWYAERQLDVLQNAMSNLTLRNQEKVQLAQASLVQQKKYPHVPILLMAMQSPLSQQLPLAAYAQQALVDRQPEFKYLDWTKAQGTKQQIHQAQCKVMIDWLFWYGTLNVLTNRLE